MPGTGFFERHQSVRAMRHREFRLLLAGTTFSGFTQPVQFITQVFWVQAEHPGQSVLYAGLLAASRGLATLIFSLVGGAIADRYERRRVLFISQVLALGIHAAIAVLMLTSLLGSATVFAVLVLTFFGAGNQSIDAPARTASLPDVVGREDLANAISLNMMSMQLAIPIAFPIVGLLNGVLEPGAVYAGTLIAWIGILPLIAMLRFRSVGKASSSSMVRNIRDGLAYTRRDGTIFAVISVVLIMQVVGMPGVTSLGPVWMTEVLGMDKRDFGLVAMAWGLGALSASVVMARQHRLAARGTTLCAAALLFAAAAILFGHSRSIALSALANGTLGFAMITTTVAAATIVQQVVSDEMRGRVMSLFPLANGLAMLNAAPISAVSQVVGLTVVVPALGWATLVLLLLVVGTRPTLRRLRPAPLPATAGTV